MRLQKSFLEEALPASEVLFGTSAVSRKISTVSSEEFARYEQQACTVSIDSRSITDGEVFIATSGKRVDGHDFVNEAVEKGARGLIIQEGKKQCLATITSNRRDHILVLVVSDTIHALISMAKAWRAHFSLPVVGISGSIGKTTTKEMLRSIVDTAQVPACVAFGNQNTRIGTALNLLRLNERDKVAIFELGISEPGEMEELADMVRPTIGVLTTIGHSHAEFLGSLQAIAHEKCKLFTFLRSNDVGVIPGDVPLLSERAYHHPVIRFGLKKKNQIQARKISLASKEETQAVQTHITFLLRLYKQETTTVLHTLNPSMVHNALAAISCAYLLGIPLDDIKKGLALFQPYQARFERRRLKNGYGFLINDAHNASPESVKSAITAFEALSHEGKKIVVLGDMLELGEKEFFWHRQIGRILCKTSTFDHLILVGERAKLIAKTAPLTIKIDQVNTWQDAQALLESVVSDKVSILLKSSLAVGLTNIAKTFS